MLVKVLAVFLICCSSSAYGFTIQCRYEHANWLGIEEYYTCFGTVTNPNFNTSLLSVTGDHLAGLGDSDVRGLSIYNNFGTFSLPLNIGNVLPNLAALEWVFGNLTVIEGNELSSLPNLEILSVYGNQIETLNSDLFSDTPNIRHIDFGFNLLRFVGDQLFNSLPQLNWALFLRNPCINEIAATPEEIQALGQRMATSCAIPLGIITECVFSDEIWLGFEQYYTCTGSIAASGNNPLVLLLFGDHPDNRSDADVTGLSIYNQRGLSQLPSDLSAVSGLLAFEWVFGDLTSLSVNDFSSLPNLEIISFYGNRLTRLDGNLLQSTLNLQIIDFGFNSLISVGNGLLTNLTQLRWALFERNPCISISISTPEDLLDLPRSLESQCPATVQSMDCDFSALNWAGIFEYYTCVGRVTSGHLVGSNFWDIAGVHVDGFTNANVTGLSIYNQRGFDRLPNIGRAFENLRGFEWVFGNLATINEFDLIQMRDLEMLSLYGNFLVTLSGSLLINNQALVYIDFGRNLLSFVGDGLLSNLPELRWALLERNLCIDEIATTPQEIEALPGRLEGLCPAENGTTIRCVYSNENWAGINEYYTCTGRIFGPGSWPWVGSAIGDHDGQLTNADVTGLSIYNALSSSRLPSGFDAIFPNLRGFEWVFGNLETISANDLSALTNLEMLSLYGNNLMVLEGNLFQNTPRLQHIDFGRNELTIVEDGIFNGLTDLFWAIFTNNPCINEIAATPEDVMRLPELFARQCRPMNGQCPAACEIDDLRARVAALEGMVLALIAAK